MAALAVPTTATFTLLDLPGTNYRLRKPIVAEIERDSAGFVVSEQSTGVYHYDPDLSKSFAGFLHAFVDEFEFLQRNEDHLAPALLAQLERFRSLLEQRQPEPEAALAKQMAALDSDNVRAMLTTKLGCKEETSDHYRYILYDDDGRILGSTIVSLGAKHTIGDVLIPKMARQMNLGTSANFVGMVKCTRSRDECITVMRQISAQRTR